MEKKNIELSIRELLPFQEDFPKRLREIPDSPECLYLKGFLPKEGEHTVGIIGARVERNMERILQGLSRKLWPKKG